MIHKSTVGGRADEAFRLTRRVALAALVLSLCAVGISGCASMNASGTEKFLTAAGFQQRTPSTPKQKEIYEKMTPYKLQQGTFNGKTLYAYKDEKQGVIFFGNDKQYQEYLRMVSEGLSKAQQTTEGLQVETVAAYGIDF